MDRRIGCQDPTYKWVTRYGFTQGNMAFALSDAYSLRPHAWQRAILDDWLAVDEDGYLVHSQCLLPVPRQNGKTGVIEPRETFGLVKRGERILHTAQEYQTSKVAFDRLRQKFGQGKNDPRARYPELNALVDKYTTSANQMVLDLKNGGHIEFRTRGNSDDMGRGGTFDLVVVDEAQSYTDEQDASLSPLNSAAPLGSPQTILTGTVPNPERPHKGEVFNRLRAAMHESPTDGFCIHEWAADEVGDPTDEDRWYRCNPSLGLQLLPKALLKDSRGMSAETFAREHLGYWSPVVTQLAVIAKKDWTACAIVEPPTQGLVCFAVKFSPDGQRATLCACRRPSDGFPHVEIVESRSMSRGFGWLTDFLSARAASTALIVIDGKSYSAALYEKLMDRGLSRTQALIPKTSEVIAANASFLSAVRELRVTHYNQDALNDSATRCTRRPIGSEGGWGFKGDADTDASLVEAAALAFWAATTTKRDPSITPIVG